MACGFDVNACIGFSISDLYITSRKMYQVTLEVDLVHVNFSVENLERFLKKFLILVDPLPRLKRSVTHKLTQCPVINGSVPALRVVRLFFFFNFPPVSVCTGWP